MTDVAKGSPTARVWSSLLSRFGGKAVGLVFVVYVARFLPEAGFAGYTYLIVLAMTVGSIADTGIAPVAAREVAAGLMPLPTAYRAALPVALTGGTLGAALVLGAGLLGSAPGVTRGGLAAAAAFVLVNSLFNLQAELLRYSGRYVLESSLQFSTSAVFPALGVAALMAGLGVPGLIAALAATQVAAVVVAQVALPLPTSGGARAVVHWHLLRAGLALSIAVTGMMIAGRISYFAFANVASASVVADFSVASRFGEVASAAGVAVGLALGPVLSQAFARDPGEGRAATRALIVRWGGIAALAAAPAAAAAALMVPVLFGQNYASAVPTSVVFVATAPLMIVYFLLWYALLAARREKHLVFATGAALAVAVAGVPVVLVHPTAMVATATALAPIAAAGTACLIALRRTTATPHDPSGTPESPVLDAVTP